MRFKRILFLDFDGVLHPGLAGTFIYLPELEEFLRAHPDLGVVISSTWREQHSLDELRRFFSLEVRDRLVGATPQTSYSRLVECRLWLRQAGFSGPWVALDDDETLFPGFCEELVLCATHRGLRKPQLAELHRKLGYAD